MGISAVIYFLVTTPALAESGGDSAGFNLQQLLLNALAWIEGLGVVGGIAFIAIYITAIMGLLCMELAERIALGDRSVLGMSMAMGSMISSSVLPEVMVLTVTG